MTEFAVREHALDPKALAAHHYWAPQVFIPTPSVATTGGVYKWQGRSQRGLLTRTYWAFLVEGEQWQAPSPNHVSEQLWGFPSPSSNHGFTLDSCGVAKSSPGRGRSKLQPLPFRKSPCHRGIPHAHDSIVVRVQPWASKGITDLLSASGCRHLVRDEVPEPTEKQPVRHSRTGHTPFEGNPRVLLRARAPATGR